MDEKILKLLIQWGVIGQEDADRVQQTLNQTKEGTKDLGKESEDAGKKAEEANHHHENTRLIFSELNRIVPGLGHALHAMFSGPLGPIILMSIAIEEVHKKLKEYNDELDKQGEEAYAPHIAALEAVKKAWDDAREHQAAYLASLANIGGEEDPIAKHIKLLKELDKAKFGGADPNIDRNLLWKEWEERSADLPGAKAAQGAAATTAQTAAGRVEMLKKEQDAKDKEAADLQQKIDEAQKTLDRNKWANAHGLPIPDAGFQASAPGYTPEAFFKDSQDHIDDLARQQAAARQRSGQLGGPGGEIDAAAIAAATANEQLKNAEGRVKRDETRMHDIPEDLRAGAQVQNAQAQTKAMLDLANSQLAGTHETLQQYAHESGLTNAQIIAMLFEMVKDEKIMARDLAALSALHDSQGI